MFKKNIKFLLPFAAFVTVIPCPALHCRPGTFWTYPLIFTLMLLSCLLASAAVFLFRRSALFLLLPLGGYLFGSLLYFIVSGRWYKWPGAVFLAVFILPALGVGALFFAGIGLMRRGKRKIVPGLLCALLALFLILSAVFCLWGSPVRAFQAKRALDRWMDEHLDTERFTVGKFRYDAWEGHFLYELADGETGKADYLEYLRSRDGNGFEIYVPWEDRFYR